jgi:acyl-CoA synthetase (NDP forming)
MYTAGAIAKAVIPVIHNASKPVVIALMGERLIQEAVEHFRAAHVPEYRFPERAASALTVLAQRAEYLARLGLPADSAPAVDSSAARQILQAHLKSGARDELLPPELIERLLACYGIQAPPAFLARSPDHAAALAKQVGFPVALKVASPDISHKSDINGVLLNLWNERDAAQSFNQLVENAHLARPAAQILGVTVQRMLPPGQDVIVGAVQDAQFGPLVMFGAGGVEVEAMKDVAFSLAPLSQEEAEYMLQTTWAGRKLKGYRNLPPADRNAALQVILRFAQFAADFPELAEIEINPLRVLDEGQGAYALDVRACLA